MDYLDWGKQLAISYGIKNPNQSICIAFEVIDESMCPSSLMLIDNKTLLSCALSHEIKEQLNQDIFLALAELIKSNNDYNLVCQLLSNDVNK